MGGGLDRQTPEAHDVVLVVVDQVAPRTHSVADDIDSVAGPLREIDVGHWSASRERAVERERDRPPDLVELWETGLEGVDERVHARVRRRRVLRVVWLVLGSGFGHRAAWCVVRASGWRWCRPWWLVRRAM